MTRRHRVALPASVGWSHDGRWVVFPSTSYSNAHGYTVLVPHSAPASGAAPRRTEVALEPEVS